MYSLKEHKYTMNSARQHIENIRSCYLSIDEEFVLSSLKNSMECIILFFGWDGAFITEFVNNADDAKSTKLRIEFTENCIKMVNDGAPLNHDDVNSLCMVGYSPKQRKDTHPSSGTGFKSAFMVSDHIELYSGEYSFMFSKAHWQNPKNIPWQLIPIWIDTTEQLIPDGFNTLFRIEIKAPYLMERLRRAAFDEHIQPKALLFLESIERIELKDYTSNTHRYIDKELIKKTPEYAIYRLKESVNGSERPYEDWLLFTSTTSVPERVLKELSPSETIPSNQTGKMSIAFRLHKDGDLLLTGLGYPVQFSTSLSRKKTRTRFNFLVQADFLSCPLQPDSVEENPWNRWLCGEIYRMLVKRCIPVFLKDPRWSKSFLEVLYPAEQSADRLLEEAINKPLKKYLEEEAVLTALDGSAVRAQDALLIMSSKIKDLISSEELKALYPDKKVLHPALKIPYEIKKLIKEGPDYSDTYGANKELLKLLELKASVKEMKFFKRFYHHLSEFAEVLRNSYLKYSNIVLTENWELVDPGFAYIKKPSLSVPDRLKDTVKVVHPELASDSMIKNTLKLLGVEELTQEYIEAMLQIKDKFRI